MEFKCTVCSQTHDSIPHIGADFPDHYLAMSESERKTRCEIGSDTCIIDGRDFLVRGVIEIPVIGCPEIFGWGVWVSLKKENFDRYLETFEGDAWPAMGPFFGWLCTNIGYYKKETLLLKTAVHIRREGLRPRIEVAPVKHPLARDAEKGISVQKVFEILHYYQG